MGDIFTPLKSQKDILRDISEVDWNSITLKQVCDIIGYDFSMVVGDLVCNCINCKHCPLEPISPKAFCSAKLGRMILNEAY